MTEREAIAPEVFRRNIAVSGLNLLALKGKTFRIGGVVLESTGLCHPCSKMHGDITTRVVEGGDIALGNNVQACL